MTDQIKYAETKIKFFQEAFAKTDEYYFYEQACGWINHRADLVKEKECAK